MKKQPCEPFKISTVLTALQQEFGATANYSTLREQLPRRLVELLMCHTVLVYLRVNDTLQLASSSFDGQSGWPSARSAVAHPNPIMSIESTAPEARAWRNQHTVYISDEQVASIATPLIYRQQSIGVLVVIRGSNEKKNGTSVCWHSDEVESLAAIAGVIALLFEHTRLLEHNRERIHELSLLNSISSQMNSLYELDYLRNIIIQRTKEICAVDLCEMLEPTHQPDISSWVSSALHEQLFAWYRTQHAPVPLVIERHKSTDGSHFDRYFALLPTSIKTFIALPLLSTHTTDKQNSGQLSVARKFSSAANILGIVAGGYHDARKVQQTELALLQSLAGQAGAALESIYLMAEVIEARNEARMLLRRVVDDQRLKELILESIPSGLITTDQEGRITIFNRAAATMLGYHPYEVLGLPLQKFLSLPNKEFDSPEQTSRPSVEDESSHKVEQQTVVISDRLERKRILEVQSVPLYGDQGRHVGTLTTLNDLTSIHRLEEEKRRLDRLATLGEMAANVAHEVRNPLASIKTTIQMLRDDLAKSHFFHPESLLLGDQTAKDPGNRVQESIIVILKEVERLDAIVRDLLLFARPNQLHRAWCNIPELSDQVLNQIQPQIVEANIVVHRLYEDVPPLWVDIGQMKQVLLNLFMNAIQAMPEGGVLTVACRCIPAEDTSSKLCATTNTVAKTSHSSTEESQQPLMIQQWLDLVVIDTGVGIAPENLHNVFQPFYTTKAHGIGLGLPITRRLIEDHGGQISMKSQLGYGATVSVRLPLHSSPSEPLNPDNSGLKSSEGNDYPLLKGRLVL
jgi:PAS domain S-box-containing protein